MGFRSLKLAMPRFGKLDNLFDRFTCRIHIKGDEDRTTYPINMHLTATEDSLYIEAEDVILSELPHQKYYLNFISFPKKNLVSKAGEGDVMEQDTLYLGAAFSAENPNDIRFVSTFNRSATGVKVGTGTKNDPYMIADGHTLTTRLNNSMSDGSNSNKEQKGVYYKLCQNINLQTDYLGADGGWVPFGMSTTTGKDAVAFQGDLDGAGYKIEVLNCKRSVDYAGLFRKIGRDAKIHNIEFAGVLLEGEKYIGAIAAESDGGKIENIKMYGSITGKGYMGGLVGSGNATFKNCYVSAYIAADEGSKGTHVGGYIGGGSGMSDFTLCIFDGSINTKEYDNVGGLAGEFGSGSISSSYIGGSIIGRNNVGGLCGSANSATISECKVGALMLDSNASIKDMYTGQTPHIKLVSINGGNNVGGFLGKGNSITLKSGDQEIMYHTSKVEEYVITGKEYVGGLGGHLTKVTINGKASFTNNGSVKGNRYVGGIAGYMSDFSGKDSKCLNNASVDGAEYTGGIIGLLEKVAKGRFKNSGAVKGTLYVGGIAGSAKGDIDITVQNEGSVTGSSQVGGCYGNMINSTFNTEADSYIGQETSTVLISGTDKVGGLIGYAEGRQKNSIVVDVPTINATVTGNNKLGGIIGSILLESLDHATMGTLAEV